MVLGKLASSFASAAAGQRAALSRTPAAEDRGGRRRCSLNKDLAQRGKLPKVKLPAMRL
jgi:hypothetical protein